MQQQTHIRAIYTPETHDDEKGDQPDPDNAESVTIVAFDALGIAAVFIDEDGLLGRGYIGQFSNCMFVTF